jgi:alkylation response protein AidB-like acyl-CoA dehydrogenase
MDFELSEDQVALADAMRSVIKGRFRLDQVRANEGREVVVDPDSWDALTDAGVFSLSTPEEHGGLGLGLADTAIVFEELGRALVPGPLVATHLASRLLFDISALSGARVIGAVHPRDTGGTAAPLLIEHLDSLDALLVVHDDRLELVDPREVIGERVRSLDPLSPTTWVKELPRGEAVGDTAVAARWRVEEQVLTAAICVGIAAECCDLAVDYAKGRRQFGRPIGSFQAIKHLCADMLTRTEVARAGTYAAALTVDQPGVGDDIRAGAGAGLLATEAAVANAKTCIQVHGGMGFTWEVPAHLYLTRAKHLAASLGPQGELARTVAERY